MLKNADFINGHGPLEPRLVELLRVPPQPLVILRVFLRLENADRDGPHEALVARVLRVHDSVFLPNVLGKQDTSACSSGSVFTHVNVQLDDVLEPEPLFW